MKHIICTYCSKCDRDTFFKSSYKSIHNILYFITFGAYNKKIYNCEECNETMIYVQRSLLNRHPSDLEELLIE